MKRSGSRKFAWYGGFFLVLASVVIAVASAQAAPALKKNYTISIVPGLAAPGSSGTYTLTLTNSGGSQALGSANISVPSGFAVTAITSTSTGWSAPAALPGQQVVMWRAGTSANAIQPGATSTATLSVTAGATGSFACSSSNPWTWTSHVKQSNDFSGTGNDFTLSGPDASLTVAGLVFTPGPTQTLVSTAIAPAVKVALKDDCGTTLTSVPGSVSLGINSPNPPGALTGGESQVLSSGVATFSNLKIDASGVGYTLQATPIGLNVDPATSDSFNIIDALCTKAGGPTHCTASNTDTTVSVPVPPNGTAQTALSVGKPSNQLPSCSTTATSQVGSVATIDPKEYPPGTLIAVTLTYAASVATVPGTSSYVVCVFKTVSGVLTSTVALPCNKSAPPCVSNRTRNGSGGLVIVLTINASDPGGVTYN